ncbi:hypothetical protein [Streptomyces sp. DASNCL29]|nr:hypothetical protein [Streptomyces sp. DASNCL29]
MAITLRESTAMDELLRFVDSDEVDVALLPGSPPGNFTITPSPRKRSY